MGSIYDAAVAHLGALGWSVAHDGDGFASFEVDAPTPWRVHLWAREDAGQLLVHSVLPFQVPDDRCLAVAVFVTRANFGLSIGNFELDMDNGELRYKTSIDVGALPLADALLRPLFVANIATTHRYLPGVEAVLRGVDPTAAVLAIEQG